MSCELLTPLDREIQDAQTALDPDARTYRYDAVRLDVLTLRRDVMVLQKAAECAEAERTATQNDIRALQLKNEVLEAILIMICKPETRDSLTVKVADMVVERWEHHLAGRVQ